MNRSGLPVHAVEQIHCSTVLVPRRVGMLCLLCLFWAGLFAHAQAGTAQHALELMQAGNFREAEIIWQQLAKTDPRNAGR